MNPNTGHLMEFNPNVALPSDYVQLPESLNHAAKVKLAGKKEAYVSLTSGGKLSQWAKAKRKAKIAAASRRRNRK